MAEYLVQDTSLTAVADAIRAKTGGSDPLAFPTGMVNAISGISGGENLDEELATQGELIEQIFTAIEGKVGGGSSGGGSTFETSATGRIPEYEHGNAIINLNLNISVAAVGALT